MSDPNRLLILFHRKGVASERRLEDVIDQFDRQSEVLPRVKWFADADRARELLAFAGLRAGERVLEVGCGPGIVLEHARNTASLLAGVDVSPRMLAEAGRRAPEAHLMQAMGERLPLREAAFDLVYSRSVLHHVLSPARMVDEMARVVGRGGRVALNDSVTSEIPIEARNHNRAEKLRDPSHGRMVPPSELQRFFGNAGLRIAAVRARRYERDLTEWLDVTSPPQRAREEIIRMFETWTSVDGAGLHVRKTDGRLRFDHTQWTILAVKP